MYIEDTSAYFGCYLPHVAVLRKKGTINEGLK